MYRALFVLVEAPLTVGIGWLLYGAGKWLAALFVRSEIDRAMMAAIATVLILRAILYAIHETDWG